MKHRILVIAPLLLLGLLVSWRLVEKKAEFADQANQRAARMKAVPSVVLGMAQIRDIARTFEALGSVEAPQNVKIAPKVTGRIMFLNLHEGDRVRAGQVLVRIDPSDVEAKVQQQMAALAEAQYRLAQAKINESPTNAAVSTQVRQQKASVASANADYNQVRENYKAQLASAAANVTDAQSRVENAKAAIKSAQANLENATTKHERMLGLFKKGFIAAQDVDDAKAAVSVQRSALEITQGQLKSAQAQKESADLQAGIVKTKGQADIEAASAKLTQARASLDYALANTAQKPAYQQSIAALQASVAAARAALRNAEALRADTVLVSPLDGFVTGRYVDPGAVATPGQPILAVQYMKQIWVTVSIPEEVSAGVHIGGSGKVVFDALPGREFTGKIIQVNPSGAESRQFMARVILSNERGLFRPGMFAHVSIETERVVKALVVPREAVQKDKLGQYVMLVDRQSKAVRRPVITGVEDTDYIAIESGLGRGDKVITMSAFPVREGQVVRAGGKRKGDRGRTDGAAK